MITYALDIRKRGSVGSGKETIGYMDLAGTYATGGFTLTPRDFGMRIIHTAVLEGFGGYNLNYDPSTGKVLVYRTGGFTPSGSISAPTFTGQALAGHGHTVPLTDNGGTPVGVQVYYDPATSTFNVDKGAGTNPATSSDSAGTPAGTNSVPTFSGSAAAAAAEAEVANGVDLSSLNRIMFSVKGV